MTPFAKTPRHARGSLLALALLAAQLAWLPPLAAQDYPQEFAPGATVPSREELPVTLGDAPAPGTRPLVVDVILQGVKDEDKALNYIRTKKEFEYDPIQLQADVRRLITSGQYRTVKTYLRNVAEGVVVIFDIVERPRINSIEFLGNRNFDDRKLLKVAGLKKGEPLNTYEVEEGRRKIEEHYRSNGFPRAQIGILEGDKADDQAVAYVISEGLLQRISWVSFEGNTFASDGVLKTKIESKPGFLWLFFKGKFDRAKLDADVEKLTGYYRDFGYFRARVGRQLELDESGKWIGVKFIIDEGPRYNVRNVSIVGNQKFRTDPLMEALKLQAGKPYNRQEMDGDLQMLRDLYGSQGHIFTVAEAEPRFLEEPGQIDLVYKIQEGEPFRVGQINVHIAGEFPHTRRNVVLNRMSLRPGDLIDIREIRNSERRLAMSQLFETQQTGGEPPRIVVRPPELQDTAIVGLGGGALRGQSPDNIAKLPPPTYDIDVFLPPLRDESWGRRPRLPENPLTAGEDASPTRTYALAPLINGTRRLPPIEHEE